jgi:hypothetical protein
MANMQIIPEGLKFRRFGLRIGTKEGTMTLLLEEHEIVVDTANAYITLVDWQARSFCDAWALGQEEVTLLLVLLNDWPSFVPNERLLQVMLNATVEQIAALLEHDPSQVEQLQRLMDTCRSKMHRFGIEIEDVHGDGYKLSRLLVRAGELGGQA